MKKSNGGVLRHTACLSAIALFLIARVPAGAQAWPPPGPLNPVRPPQPVATQVAITATGTVTAAPQVMPMAPRIMPAATNVIVPVKTEGIPNGWEYKAKGYEKAKEIQKLTSADILIVFTRQDPPNEKGLCNWLRSNGFENNKVKKYLKNYIRVEVPLPSSPESAKLAEDFKIMKCPAVYIVQPTGLNQYCKMFTYEMNRPKLMEPEALIEAFRSRSSLWYSTLPTEK